MDCGPSVGVSCNGGGVASAVLRGASSSALAALPCSSRCAAPLRTMCRATASSTPAKLLMTPRRRAARRQVHSHDGQGPCPACEARRAKRGVLVEAAPSAPPSVGDTPGSSPASAQEPADVPGGSPSGKVRSSQLAADSSCCCHSEEPSTASADPCSPVTDGVTSEGRFRLGSAWWLLLAVPVAVVILNPTLLPFDIEDAQDWLEEAIYTASQDVNSALSTRLGEEGLFSPGLLSLVFSAGLLTSFAPCTLSVLPLTIGYIAGTDNNDRSKQGSARQESSPSLQQGSNTGQPFSNPLSSLSSSFRVSSVSSNAFFFSLGLASSFAGLGVSAALAGKAYGQIGPGLPIAVSCATMAMGLNLLGLFRFQLPSLFANFDAKEAAASLPVPVQMYLAGVTFAFLASPCCTPVLASLLAFVASSEDVAVGGTLLLAYTCGRVMPILAAASFTGSLKQLLSLRQYSRWITPASGALLLGVGTFSLLDRVFPESTAMASTFSGPM